MSRAYEIHLSRDKIMRKIIRMNGSLSIRRKPDTCLHLCRSILSQQISIKVARVLEERLLALLPASGFSPDALLEIPQPKLRSIGLSSVKAAYIQNVARFYAELGLQDDQLKKLDNQALIELLTQIKGVGQWTVEMLLIFSLGRKDVFPLDDYGIRLSMIRYYGITGGSSKDFLREMSIISSAWAPYRSYAALHLWKAKDAG